MAKKIGKPLPVLALSSLPIAVLINELVNGLIGEVGVRLLLKEVGCPLHTLIVPEFPGCSLFDLEADLLYVGVIALAVFEEALVWPETGIGRCDDAMHPVALVVEVDGYEAEAEHFGLVFEGRILLPK